MNIKKLLCLVLVLFFTAEFTPAIEELLLKPVELKNGSVLSVNDCVSLAFKNSPKIKRQKYNLDITKSRVGIAKSQYFPVISAGVGFYNENNSDNIYYNKHYRELPNVGVSINKLIWNFGKTTAFIKMEEFYKLGAEYEFMDSLCATLFDVKAKYYNVLKEQALGKVAQEKYDLFDNFVKIARHKPDLTSAKVNLTQAKSNLISAETGYKNAIEDLNNSKDAFTEENLNFSIEKAVDIAYESSPDLQVLISTRKAMEQSLKYVKRTYLPDLKAGVGYGFYNTNQTVDNSFNVGVNLSSDINLMELRHSIKGADAQLALADNEITLFKKDLYFELNRAFNNVNKAERQIPIDREFLKQASESLKVVEAQYKAGKDEVDYTSYRDAITDYTDALARYVNAVYDYNLALIQVEMAMHYHIVDIHHKSEHAMHYHSDDLIKHLIEALDCDEHEAHHHKL